MSNFTIYMIGTILVACALGYAAYLLGLGTAWIAIGMVIIIGLGIMGGVRKTRRPEKPN